MPITRQEYLLAYIADRIANLVWMQSEDGYKHRNQPKMILPQLLEIHREEKKEEISLSDAVEEYKASELALKAAYGNGV